MINTEVKRVDVETVAGRQKDGKTLMIYDVVFVGGRIERYTGYGMTKDEALKKAGGVMAQ